MTDAEWQTSADPQAMIETGGKTISERKLRLVLCGWARLNWKWMGELARDSVVVAEGFADGDVDDMARRDADALFWDSSRSDRPTRNNWLVRVALENRIDLMPAAMSAISRNPKVARRQADIVRDVIAFSNCSGSQYSNLLARNHATVPAMARRIYDERTFHDLPILADALQDAGCTDPDILAHCRSGGEHVRGCWVVDLILGNS
jgi:hypothetical protein